MRPPPGCTPGHSFCMSVSQAARASATACCEGPCVGGDCEDGGVEEGGEDDGGVEDGGDGSRSSASAACAAMTVQKMSGSNDLGTMDSCLGGQNARAADAYSRTRRDP
jgi:hypothetical protein